MRKYRLNGANCTQVYNQEFLNCIPLAVPIGTPVGAPIYCQGVAQNKANACKCKNNAQWYYDNKSFSSLNINSGKHTDIEVYNWAITACDTEPLRTKGSSANETASMYYQEFLKSLQPQQLPTQQQQQQTNNNFEPIQQKAGSNLILYAAIGLAATFLIK